MTATIEMRKGSLLVQNEKFPKGEVLSNLMGDLDLVHRQYQAFNNSFLRTTQFILSGDSVGLRVANMLRFGDCYHRLGLEAALDHPIKIGTKTDIYNPIADTVNGSTWVYGFSTQSKRTGELVGLVGVHSPNERRVGTQVFDGVARVLGKNKLSEYIAVGVLVKQGSLTVFVHPDQHGAHSKNIEELFPPLLMAQGASTESDPMPKPAPTE